ncbi:MAG: cobalt-precorrin-5B (C(1))-methyltransferase, partial [Clostridia bacterium]
ILGTTGIVEPMSEQALVKTIQICVRKAKSKDSARILLSPGNYGRDYCLRQLGVDLENGIKFSNFLGETLDYVVYEGFTEALLVGHIGKMVKVGRHHEYPFLRGGLSNGNFASRGAGWGRPFHRRCDHGL